MLNKAERYKALKYLRICFYLGLHPIQVDLAKWELKGSSAWKQCVCFASYSLFVLHTLYKTGSLAYVFFFEPDVQLHQLVIHAILVMASILVAFWYYVLYLRSPELFASFVKMSLLGNVGGSELERDQVGRHWRSRLREYSLQDLIATGLPPMTAMAVAVIVAAYVYDQSMRLLLYAALPGHLQTWATFILCLLEEIRFLILMTSTSGPGWLLQIISLDLVCNLLGLSIKKIQNGAHSPRSVYRSLRHLQLYMSAFNSLNSYVIFSWKLTSISICIISGYAAIAHFREVPIFGIMYYVLLVDCGIIYAVIYEKAFRIPQLFDRTVGCAMLRMLNGNRTGIFGRQMRSIPSTGVQVGHFHTMERASTLIFLDFVVVNIVNMLVAYG